MDSILTQIYPGRGEARPQPGDASPESVFSIRSALVATTIVAALSQMAVVL